MTDEMVHQRCVVHRAEVQGAFGHPASTTVVTLRLEVGVAEHAPSPLALPFVEMQVTVAGDRVPGGAVTVWASDPAELDALGVALHTAADVLGEWQSRFA